MRAGDVRLKLEYVAQPFRAAQSVRDTLRIEPLFHESSDSRGDRQTGGEPGGLDSGSVNHRRLIQVGADHEIREELVRWLQFGTDAASTVRQIFEAGVG